MIEMNKCQAVGQKTFEGVPFSPVLPIMPVTGATTKVAFMSETPSTLL